MEPRDPSKEPAAAPERAQQSAPVWPHPPTKSSAFFKSLGGGLVYFAVYLIVQFAVSVPFALIIGLKLALTEGVGDLAAFSAALTEAVNASGGLLTACINVASLAVFALVLYLQHKNVWKATGFTRVRWTRLIPLVPLGVALNILFTAVISLLPQEILANYQSAAGQVLPEQYGLLSFLFIAVLAPLAEETLFRGLMYGSFRRGMGGWAAALLSSALFGLMHGQILWMIYTALLGVLLCSVRERYASLTAAVVLHASFNAGSYLAQLTDGMPLVPLLAAAGTTSVALLVAVFAGDKNAAA